MRLQIETVDIADVQFNPKTLASDHVLYVNPEELKELILRDESIRNVNVELAYPDEKTRIVNVVDILQPRCKIDKDKEDFPGWLGELAIAGVGRTRSLGGVSVVLSNRFSKRPYAALIDMFGIGADVGRYGKMKNICIDPEPSVNVDERHFEAAVKRAGLKTAVYLARAAQAHVIDNTEIYDLDLTRRGDEKCASLPRVAYYYQLHTPQLDYQGRPDPIFYGTDMVDQLPMIVHPNEILDGGILHSNSAICLDTYSIQNHAVIKELYGRNGKELWFTGVVVGVASLEPNQRQRMAMTAANLFSNVLGADGVILTKVFGGMPHVDLSLTAEACEKMGIKTTLFVSFWHSVGSIAEQIYFRSELLDSIVNVGQYCEMIRLPKADMILGGAADTPIYNPHATQKAGGESVEIEGNLLAGAFDMLGGTNKMAVEY